jgi:hypothetical protein
MHENHHRGSWLNSNGKNSIPSFICTQPYNSLMGPCKCLCSIYKTSKEHSNTVNMYLKAAQQSEQSLMAIILLVRGGASLVELRKTHAYTHWMLQVLFSTTTHTCLFLFVKCLAPKRLHTVTETSLNQWVIHLQAATPFKEPESIRPCSQRPCFHSQHNIKPNSQPLPYWNWERKRQNTAYYMWSAKGPSSPMSLNTTSTI